MTNNNIKKLYAEYSSNERFNLFQDPTDEDKGFNMNDVTEKECEAFNMLINSLTEEQAVSIEAVLFIRDNATQKDFISRLEIIFNTDYTDKFVSLSKEDQDKEIPVINPLEDKEEEEEFIDPYHKQFASFNPTLAELYKKSYDLSMDHMERSMIECVYSCKHDTVQSAMKLSIHSINLTHLYPNKAEAIIAYMEDDVIFDDMIKGIRCSTKDCMKSILTLKETLEAAEEDCIPCLEANKFLNDIMQETMKYMTDNSYKTFSSFNKIIEDTEKVSEDIILKMGNI